MAKNLEQRVAELEKKVKELTGNAAVKISKKLGIGDIFTLAGLEWTILDVTEQGYKCLAEKLPKNMQFDGNCNNWQASDLCSYLNIQFYKELEDAVGTENIIAFERDLLSLDGQTEYGSCEDHVSLLTVDEYRKYRALIPNADYWWWLVTPWSTPCNGYEKTITVVSPSGFISLGDYVSNRGVRPFCIFSSAIFESGDK